MNACRRGGALKALLVLIVVGALGAMTWVTIANWRKDGEFSLRLFDPEWWTLSRPAPASPQGLRDAGKRDAETIADQAKRLARDAKDSLWGRDGLVERAEGWWSTHVSRSDRPAAAPSAAAPDRRRLEQQLAGADQQFRAGLDAYQRASPTATGSAADKRAAVVAAQAKFQRAHDLLAENLAAYDALPDRDEAVSRSAHQLQSYNQQLLEMTSQR